MYNRWRNRPLYNNSWKEIISISCGTSHTVGLKSNGTVVATGYNKDGVCNVSDWKLFDDIDAAIEQIEKRQAQTKEKLLIGIEKRKAEEQKLIEAEKARKEAEKARKEAEKARKEAATAAKKARQEAASKAKIESLEKEKAELEAELPTIKGLFSGGKKAKVQARIAEIEKELKTLK